VKTKATPQAQSSHKPATSAKAEAKPSTTKASTSVKKAEKLPALNPSRPDPGSPKKEAIAVKDEQPKQSDAHRDPHASQDPSDENSPSQRGNDSSPISDQSTISDAAVLAAAQLAAASTQADAATPESVGDAPKRSGDSSDSKKGKDNPTDSSNKKVDPTVSSQLTAQAIAQIASNGSSTNDQGNGQGPPDQQNNAPPTTAVATTPQSSSPTRTSARVVQSVKTSSADVDPQLTDPTLAQSIASPGGATATADPAPDSPSKPAGSALKSADDILAKIGAAQGLLDTTAPKPDTAKVAPSAAPAPQRPEARFAEANHPTIVTDIKGKLLPDGGSMDIHLSPPDLGAMRVRVEVRDGAITASFQAADEQTAKLLSHSLGDLKTALEAQGVSVEKLHVSQMPREQQPSQNNNGNSSREPDRQQQQAAQQEQQRRDMTRRMWRRLMKNQDPLDLVA
jgi:flagellar hook-length control protein FliK